MGGHGLETTVVDVLAGQLGVPVGQLHREADLETDLRVADDDADRLLGALGEALEARFPDDFLDGIRTVGDLSSAVRRALSA